MDKWTPTTTTVNGEKCSAFTDGNIVIAYETFRDKDRETGEVFYVADMLGELPDGIGLTEGGEIHHSANRGFGKTRKLAIADFAESLSYHEAVPHDCEAEGC